MEMEKICISLKGNAIDALERAEKCISNTNLTLLSIENYQFNMGKFYAILDALELIDDDVWSEVWDNFSETVGKLDKLCEAAEVRYRK